MNRVAALLVLALTLGAVVPIGFGVSQALRENENDLADWLPAAYEETREYRDFQRLFGSEDFVIASWPGCTIDAPQLTQFAAVLLEQDEALAADSQARLLRRVITGSEIVDQLAAPPASLTLDDTLERLRGTLIGPDGEQTCALITLSPAGRRAVHRSLALIQAAAAAAKVPEDALHLGGPPVVNAAIDRASASSLSRLSALAALIGIGVASVAFRSFKLTCIVFGVSVFGTLAALALIPATGSRLNAVVVTMVPLVYVAAMSGAIHFVHYFREEQASGSPAPVTGAWHKAVVPLVLAALTTSVGLLSLLTGDLAPIRQFGLYSALGVLLAFTTQLTLLPTLLWLWAPRRLSPPPFPADDAAEASCQVIPSSWTRLAAWSMEQRVWLRLVTLVLFALAGAGLLHVTTSIQIMRLFGQGHSVLASYAWLEERLGGLVPMEIVLHYDQQQASSTIARLHLVEDLEASLRSLPDVRGCLSAATFTPRVPSAGLWIRRFATEKMIVRARPRLLDSGFLADHGAGEAWRVSTRLASSGDPDYGLLHQQLLAHTQRFLAARQREQGELPRVTITGAVPILFKARRSLLSGMSLGLLLDVALVCVAVAVLLRRISLALLLAVVCLLPVAMVFGAMGLLGIVVDIGSVMAPCVALGVTVDDVIHWLLWYQRGQSQGLTASRAIELAHARCAPAMVQSWGVIGLGLTVFTLSPFVPTFRFGLLMVLLLTVNLVGNLVLLPALVPQRKALEA